jgi:hypothetical protein
VQAKDSTIKPLDAQKKLVEELNVEWKHLWSNRFNDKQRAEGISITNYTALRVEKGTVIHATKDFKALNFKEILEEHMVENPERFISPDVDVGGWHKFIKTKITSGKSTGKNRVESFVPVKPKGGQPKKGGRGWLHTA